MDKFQWPGARRAALCQAQTPKTLIFRQKFLDAFPELARALHQAAEMQVPNSQTPQCFSHFSKDLVPAAPRTGRAGSSRSERVHTSWVDVQVP